MGTNLLSKSNSDYKPNTVQSVMKSTSQQSDSNYGKVNSSMSNYRNSQDKIQQSSSESLNYLSTDAPKLRNAIIK